MNDFIMYKLLSLISKKTSIGTMFKLGYSYSNIVTWYLELETDGYVVIENDEHMSLTALGEKKMLELEKNRKNFDWGKLEQYKIKKKSLEDIYLP